MKEIVRTLSTGEEIYIFDDVFPAVFVFNFEKFVQELSYQLTGSSYVILTQENNYMLSTALEQDAVEKTGFTKFNTLNKIFNEKIGGNYVPIRSWVLVSSYLSRYLFHADDSSPLSKTLLYHVNNKWDKDWGGETLFCNSAGEVETAVEFKPGRVIIFNSTILHKPAPVTLDAPIYRYSFTSTFVEQK